VKVRRCRLISFLTVADTSLLSLFSSQCWRSTETHQGKKKPCCARGTEGVLAFVNLSRGIARTALLSWDMESPLSLPICRREQIAIR
jgi:hypothetical protein